LKEKRKKKKKKDNGRLPGTPGDRRGRIFPEGGWPL